MGKTYDGLAVEAVQMALEHQKAESERQRFAYGVGVEIVGGDSAFLQWVRGEGRSELDVVEIGFPAEREDITRGCLERGLVPKPELSEFNIWEPPGLPRSWGSEKDLADYLAAFLTLLGGEGPLSFSIFPDDEGEHSVAAIDEGFPIRYRVSESKPSAPDWASDVREPDEWSWQSSMQVTVPGAGTIEVFQSAERNEDDLWEVSEPLVDVTESGVGDPNICEAIADAIDAADTSRIGHFLLWNDALDEGRNTEALHAYAKALRDCASLLRRINPNRQEDYPSAYG